MAKAIKLITGVWAIDKAFRELPLKLQKKALRPALRESAKIVAEKARQKIPVASGKALATIKATALKRSRVKLGMKIAAGASDANSGLPYYIKWVEFGTKQRFNKKGANRGKVLPETKSGFLGFGKRKGFLRISLHETRKPANKIFIEHFKETMRDIKPVT